MTLSPKRVAPLIGHLSLGAYDGFQPFGPFGGPQMTCRATAVRLLVVGACFVGSCGSGVSELPPESEIQDLLAANLSQDWSLIESQAGQAPPGHGPVEASGRLYVLLGPGAVAFQWKDESGQWHNEDLAREALELWVMPGAYRPSPRRFVEHHRHVPPERIYASEEIRVYGRVSHRVVAEDRFNELLKVAYSTSWSDISEATCTWQDCPEAIAASLGAEYD